MLRGSLAILAIVGIQVGTAQAAVETGAAAPDFTLTDVAGNEHTLHDHLGSIIILEWTNYDCPFVRKFYNPGVMQEWQKAMADQGIVWLTICSSAPGTQGHFSQEVWKQRMEDWSVVAPVLLDESGDVGRAFGARVTPHMYVIDTEGRIAYQGAIDSIRSVNPDDIERADNYVKAAVEALLAGEEVEITDTTPYGCTVKYE